MIFRSENDVREWVRKNVDKAWWFEGRSGSSHNLPDVLVSRGGRMALLELKLAELYRPRRKSELAILGPSSGRIELFTVKAHPGQIRTIAEMNRFGVPAWVLAGVSGKSTLMAVRNMDRLVRVSNTKGFARRGKYVVKSWLEEWDETENGLWRITK